jgi:hypothetical protein
MFLACMKNTTDYHWMKQKSFCSIFSWLVWVMVFNTTFNNISAISWHSVLLVSVTRYSICRRVMSVRYNWCINCILQTSHVYICLVTDTSVVSCRHHTSTYVLSQTHQLYLTMSVRHNCCVCDKTYVDVWCLEDTTDGSMTKNI